MRLAIIGAGGHGRVVAESAVTLGWQVVFFDDELNGDIDGWPISGKPFAISDGDHDGVIVAIGNNRTRNDWLVRLRLRGTPLVSVIDPSAIVSASAQIGHGSFIARGAIVSTGAVVGRGCIVNTGASVDHDCQLANAVHLSPGVRLSGGVRIGECSWLGTGTSVRNEITIGHDVVVGVGSAVVSDIASGHTAVGVPARIVENG